MGLDAWTDTEYQQAEQQIRILSGLYGVLRPMDRIQAHRLEMGTRQPTIEAKIYTNFEEPAS